MIKNDIERVICSLLNLKEDDVEKINCNCDHIYVFLAKKKYKHCPICGSIKVYSKGFYSRNLIIPANALKTYNVHLEVRRYKCQDCFYCFSDSKQLSPVNRKISYATILNVMEMLKSPRCTFTDAAVANGILQSSTVRIFDNY